MRRLACLAVLLAMSPLMFAPEARAEGSGAGRELDQSQALRSITDIYVDILDFSIETFVWTGKGDVDVRDPSGALVGTFSSGDVITPAMNGAYRIDLLEDQFDVDAMGNAIRSTIVAWDVTVSVSGVPRIGRVFS